MKTPVSCLVLLFSSQLSATDIPADFADVGALIPSLQVRMAYLGSDNFVGSRVDGYEANILISFSQLFHKCRLLLWRP